MDLHYRSTFQTVSETGMLVPQLLMELSSLPPTESVLQRHIQDFYRKLEYKAISALKYLEFLRYEPGIYSGRKMAHFNPG